MSETAFRAGVRMRWVGRELRRWRERIGLTGADAAKLARWSPGKLSKVENAIQPIQGVDVLALGLVYDVNEEERDRLFRASLSALDRGWWNDYDEDVLGSAVQDYVELESEAASMCTFKPDLIPGLLQTERYAEQLAHASLPKPDRETVTLRAEARSKRQARLTGANPMTVHAVIWEAALRQAVGGPKVMGAQLDRLRELAERPTITVQVLPIGIGAYPAMGSSFNVVSFHEEQFGEVVYVENLTKGFYIEEPADVEAYTLHFAALREVALDPSRSVALVAKIAKDL